MNTNETQVEQVATETEAKLASKKVSQVEFFKAYQDLLDSKGFDENNKPVATMGDLEELFPELSPLTVKQKLYAVRSVVNAKGNVWPMLPTGKPRKKRESKKPTIEAQLLQMAQARQVFDTID